MENRKVKSLVENTYKISAKGIEIFSAMGYYPIEEKIENHFLVNVEIRYSKLPIENEFVNYEVIVETVKEEFQKKHQLLEYLAMDIINSLNEKAKGEKNITCEIEKLNPAFLGQKVKLLSVEISKKFEL